jgi:MFS transporter, DHA1 family, multidrug resistance protein
LHAMNEVDRELSAAEREASPRRYNGRQSDEIERVLSASSVSTSSSDATSVRRTVNRDPTADGMSRVSTQADLERHPTELSRIHTARSQHSATVGRSLRGRESRKPLPAFGAGKPFPPPLPDREEYVVEFDGPDDPMHAQNWPFSTKMFTAAILGYTTLTASFASSIFSVATRAVAAEFDVSNEVGVCR